MSANRLEREAWKQARRLGHDWVGSEHGILAMLLGPKEDVAARALRDAGMTAEVVERHLKAMAAADLRAQRSPTGASPNPAFYRVLGRAEGIAASTGASEPEPVHLLLAMLWDRRAWGFAEAAGITRDRIVSWLQQLGVALLPAPMPTLDRVPRLTQRVEFPLDKLEGVLTALRERHPPTDTGPMWGFNHDGAALAWVVAEGDIDLDAIVAEALGGSAGS